MGKIARKPRQCRSIRAKWQVNQGCAAMKAKLEIDLMTFNWGLLQEILLWKVKKWSYEDGYGIQTTPEKPLNPSPTTILKRAEKGRVENRFSRL
jgi:hypothetical protein